MGTERTPLRRWTSCLVVVALVLLLSETVAGATVNAAPPGAAPAGALNSPMSPHTVAAESEPSGALPSVPSWDPGLGKSSPGVPHYRLATISRASGNCPNYVASPAWMSFDPINGTFWVASGDCVDEILFPTTGWGFSLVQAIPVGSDAFDVAVDNVSNDVFVTNFESNNVTVISANSSLPIASVPTGAHPTGVSYDWRSDQIYVANLGSNNVTIISGRTLSVVGSVPVGSGPVGVVADPQDHRVFVANSGSSNVTVISDLTTLGATSVAVGGGPSGIAWDNTTDQIFVADNGTNNFTVIDAASDTTVASIPVLGLYITLEGVAYDWRNNTVWAGGGRSYAVVVNASSDVVLGYAGTDPSGVGYDPANGDICFSNTGNLTFECFEAPWYTTPATAVTFSEQGLPPAESWSVSVTESTSAVASTSSETTNLTFGAFPSYGSFPLSYQVPTVGGYAATPSSGVVNCGNCGSQQINISFAPLAGTYPVQFNESGLPAGSFWSVDLNGTVNRSTSPTNGFRVPNGTAYGFTITVPPGFSATPAAGQFRVNGSPVWVAIAIGPRTGYRLQFDEIGLPSGTTWVVILDGTLYQSTTSAQYFELSNGTYPFEVGQTGLYTPTPAAGNVTISGAPVTLSINFTAPASYPASFGESGLAPGTPWYAWVGGATAYSTSPTLVLNLPNGTYPFVITATGYLAPNGRGNLTIDGGPYGLNISFVPAPYTVSFEAAGLPPGSVWEAALDGVGQAGFASVEFQEPNGTFPYQVFPTDGETPLPQNGSVTVDGRNVSVSITFGPQQFPVVFVESGLPAGTPWSVVVVGVVENSSAGSIAFQLPNGTYPYSVSPVAGFDPFPSGNVTVDGSGVVVPLSFQRDVFTLTFTEVGLPNGTGWGVAIGDLLETTLNASVAFEVPNGTYGYVVLAIDGYVTTSSGLAVVSGTDLSVTVVFHPALFPIVFVVLGLPTGSAWSVTVVNRSAGFNQTESSYGESLTFFLANGTYTFSFTLPPGFQGNVTSTSFTVDGSGSPGVTVGVGPGVSRNPTIPFPWIEAVSLVGALLAGGALVGWWAGRRRRSPPQVPSK